MLHNDLRSLWDREPVAGDERSHSRRNTLTADREAYANKLAQELKDFVMERYPDDRWTCEAFWYARELNSNTGDYVSDDYHIHVTLKSPEGVDTEKLKQVFYDFLEKLWKPTYRADVHVDRKEDWKMYYVWIKNREDADRTSLIWWLGHDYEINPDTDTYRFGIGLSLVNDGLNLFK